MARSKDLKVNIVGDADKLDRELRRSSNSLDKFGKQTKLTATASSKGFAAMKVGATGAAAGMAGLALAGKRVVQASMESEKSQAALQAQLKSSGISWKAHQKEIEGVIGMHSALAGVDDEELQDAFTNLVRSTGSVNTAMKDMSVVTDLARARNIDVAKAATMVAKVHAGAVTPLKAMGIEFTKTTANVDKLKASNDKITPAQLAAAKAADKQANSQRALGLVQDKVKGQAEAYGKTTAGAMDRAGVAIEGVEESIGAALAPTVEKAANKLANFVNGLQNGTGQGGRFADKLKEIWSEAKPIVTWIGRATKNVVEFTAEHPNVARLAGAVLGVGAAVKGLKFVSAATGFTALLKAGRSAAGILKRTFSSAGTSAGAAAADNAAASMAGGASTSKFRNAGKKAGRVAGKGLVVGMVAGFLAVLPELVRRIDDSIIAAPFKFASSLGKKLSRALGLGAKDAAGTLKSTIGGALSGAVGDGIGKGSLGSGKGAGSLMGAASALAPLVAVGARHGLRVSSGKRAAGGKTSSGGISYHGSGEAVDLAGSPGGMMQTFRALKSSVGGRLAELIYTPGGAGIKNGRAHRYTGKVASDHFDHVHVALDLGRPGPGIGDGDGAMRRPFTGDGPGLAAKAARSVGLSGSQLVTMVAIAGGESGYNPKINAAGPEDSRGLWQINVGPGANPDMLKLGNLYDPYVNAKAMKIILGRQGLNAWTVYSSGAYKSYLARARAAVTSSRGSTAGTSRGGSSSSGASSPSGQVGGVNIDAIAAPFMRDDPGRRSTAFGARGGRAPSLGIRSLVKGSTALGEQIESDSTVYGQAERRFGQTEEDLGTAKGRTDRLSEIKALRGLKEKTLARQQARAEALKQAISKYKTMLSKLGVARKKAKGGARAKINEQIRTDEERLDELKAELVSLGFAIEDTKLDIGDLDKDMADVAATPDSETAGAQDQLSARLSDIDLQERAGMLSPEQAKAARITHLTAALNGGGLDERQRWEVMAQLRDAQEASTQATNDLAVALAEVKASIDAQLAFADRVSSITSMEAVRAMSDMMSGQMGARTQARAQLPGSGRMSRL